MNIYDYIPDYPELENPEFNKKIQYKKEFYELRTTNEKLPFGKPGTLWPHQILLSRFVSPYTNYNEQLLFHTPGTGKTCGAVAIVEVSKQDPLVRKPVLVIVPNDTLVEQWKTQIAFTCTSGQYVPENYFTLTKGQQTARKNKLIEPVYHITTIERMRRQIDKIRDDDILKKRFSNTIIIIDEAHNLRIETGSKEKQESSKNRYNSFHRFLHVVENCKKILLTGTPMYDRISELPGLLNLILPLDRQMPVGKNFTKEFIITEKGSNIRKLKNHDKFMDYIIGMVSYIREGGNFPIRQDLGEHIWTKFIKTVPTNLSNIQLEGYLEAYNKDTKTEDISAGLFPNSRQASVFVYKDTKNNRYLWGNDAFKLLVSKSAAKTITIEGRPLTFIPLFIKDAYKKDIKENLQMYSSKYAYIIKFLQENSNSPIFIFTPLVSGAGGAIFLSLVLELFGYKKALGTTTTKEKRYAIITGEDKSSLQRKRIIDIYNSPENRNGEIIQVLIASQTISEGTSFTNVQHEIIISPYWNNSATEQAIGRGLRADSLSYLPNNERIVTVQQLAINSPELIEQKNVDARMYKMSEGKDFEIKDAERLLKQVAWDCALNYDRNVRDTDNDNSRNCDYQKCNYVCYQTEPDKLPDKWSYLIPEDDLDKSTYLIYYSKPELLNVVEKLKLVVQKYSFININNINSVLDIKDFKLLILAIEYMIENHIIVYNKWGQSCFLRKQGNTLFLSDVLTETSILSAWYTRHPFVNTQIPLDIIINNDIYNLDVKKMIDLNLKDTQKATEIINGLNIETKIFILEYLLKLKNNDFNTEQKKMYDEFLDMFKKHIYHTDELTVHDLTKVKLPNEYVDFSLGEAGNYRCLRNKVWNDCTKKEEEFISQILVGKKQDKKEILQMENDIYAKISSSTGKFWIVDKTTVKGDTTDARRIITGLQCTSWKKWQLIKFYIDLNIDSPKPIPQNIKSIKNKEELWKLIIENKLETSFTEEKNKTVSNMQKALSLFKIDVKNLCENLKQWFIENNLVQYEE
jgi:superfamily II DNA or RNA helicase